MPDNKQLEEIELQLLLEGIYERYGYDFREYALSSLKRRIAKFMRDERRRTISGLQERVLRNPKVMARFLNTISIDVTAMFRDPQFYRVFRQKVVPLLRTFPHLRIWHAGCASGEEVYSMAILLQEEGLYDRARLYATDMNESLLQEAKAGVFALKEMQTYTDNYIRAGGTREFSEYYAARYDHALFRPALKENVVWAQHNLATDASFNEFQVILCCNVMIYFNQNLQNRVHNLLYDSLAAGGILALGEKESLKFTPHEGDYEVVDEREKLYRRVK
jgi:chemotaxis protein methyltransferase CheR